LIERAPNGWEAQRQAAIGDYAALIVDAYLSDTDGETLVGRLKAFGWSAPTLVLTSSDADAVGGGDDSLPKTEALSGSTLARAIVAMIERQDLTRQLTAATNTLSSLAHDLATPLGVVMGMTQVLLAGESALSADDRLCLEDVAQAGVQAGEILKRLHAPESGSSPVVPVSAATRVTRPGIGRKVILIADDDPATRRLVCAILASDEYTVIEAADGEEAWSLIREHRPAIAILDWQMPVYTGLELTDVIKGDPQMRGTTVIMLTGRSGQADREAGARAHADVYLTKPLAPDALLAAVQAAFASA
jgi:DNA-binding response OmpR family regulator